MGIWFRDPNELMRNGSRRWENRAASKDPGPGWLRSQIRSTVRFWPHVPHGTGNQGQVVEIAGTTVPCGTVESEQTSIKDGFVMHYAPKRSPIPKQRVTKAEIEQARTPAGGLDQKAVGSVGRAMA